MLILFVDYFYSCAYPLKNVDVSFRLGSYLRNPLACVIPYGIFLIEMRLHKRAYTRAGRLEIKRASRAKEVIPQHDVTMRRHFVADMNE